MKMMFFSRIDQYRILFRPRWFSPGMIFLGFLAKSPHLQLLTEDEYKKLMTEMPVALQALRGNTLNNRESQVVKGILDFFFKLCWFCFLHESAIYLSQISPDEILVLVSYELLLVSSLRSWENYQ